MGALVAAVNKKKKSVVPMVVSMLRELNHRGKDSYGIATPSSKIRAETLEEIETNRYDSDIGIGHNFSRILSRDNPQPVQGDSYSIVFEGRLFPARKKPVRREVDEIVDKLGTNTFKNAKRIIQQIEGSYAFAIAESNRVIVGRDMFGTTPLYYGTKVDFCAIASERKALWKIGIREVRSFPPGQLMVMDRQGFSFYPVKEVQSPLRQKIPMDVAARALQFLLLEATRKKVSDLDSAVVAFSGGVDSSVVAVLADNVGIDVQLVSVGLESQQDVTFVRKAAGALDLPLCIQTYSLGELEDTLPKVIWLIEDPDPINACIAVPFFWIAETAAKLGYPVLLVGQGADELFGGYFRYLKEYDGLNVEAIEKKIFHDVKNGYRLNFERDNQVCSYHGVELRLPYIDRDVVDFALRLPLHLKINSNNDRLRKRVLRRVAYNLEMPSFIADKPKKAVQYSTGAVKALQKIAKSKKLTMREYFLQIFNEEYPSFNHN